MERAELTKLISALSCAQKHGEFYFLCDPQWRATEKALFEEQARLAESGSVEANRGWLLVPTGGTSGKLRFVRHDESTITAAVKGFCRHFGLERVNTVGVLPRWHVSGLMAQVRSAATGGRYVGWTWKQLEMGHLPVIAGTDRWTLSLVPTQLRRLLNSVQMTDWLRDFRMIFLGGGPIWPELLDEAQAARLPICTSYGMSETAAMVAALRPEEFDEGLRGAGAAMPHATITVVDEVTGATPPAGHPGVLRISGESVFRGYFPDTREERMVTTEDLGYLDPAGHLHVLGRRDLMVITGGEKVNPLEVEAILRATGELEDVVVVGLPDANWGHVLVACYPAAQGERDWTKLRQRLASEMAGYKVPKRFVPLATWPRNQQGKINRAEVLRLLARPAEARG